MSENFLTHKQKTFNRIYFFQKKLQGNNERRERLINMLFFILVKQYKKDMETQTHTHTSRNTFKLDCFFFLNFSLHTARRQNIIFRLIIFRKTKKSVFIEEVHTKID